MRARGTTTREAEPGPGTLKRQGVRGRLEEGPAEERAPILKAYLGENAMTTRQHFGVDPKVELAEFEAIAARHPVFRIVAATQGQAQA